MSYEVYTINQHGQTRIVRTRAASEDHAALKVRRAFPHRAVVAVGRPMQSPVWR